MAHRKQKEEPMHIPPKYQERLETLVKKQKELDEQSRAIWAEETYVTHEIDEIYEAIKEETKAVHKTVIDEFLEYITPIAQAITQPFVHYCVLRLINEEVTDGNKLWKVDMNMSIYQDMCGNHLTYRIDIYTKSPGIEICVREVFTQDEDSCTPEEKYTRRVWNTNWDYKNTFTFTLPEKK